MLENKIESITCQIDGARHLTLVISGSCPKNPFITDAIVFATTARDKDVKVINVVNPTTSLWRVQPAISGQLFSALQELVIEPNQSKQLSITYSPSQMTSDKVDEGFLNIPLPNNTSKLYKLTGTADKPLASAEICLLVRSRSPQKELISISNWINKPQKLSVTYESSDLMVSFSGSTTTELASGETRMFPFNVHCLKDGNYTLKLRFTNDVTGDYIWHSIHLKAQLIDPEIIVLSTTLRSKLHKQILIKNPLDTSILMTFQSSVNEVTVSPGLTLNPRYYLLSVA